MLSQKYVGKRIIWAIFMVILCIFLTFFMSNFMEECFPNIELVHRVILPILLFLLLGVVGFCLQSFFVPLVENIATPKVIKIIVPCVLIILGVIAGQLYHTANLESAVQTGLYDQFVASGVFYKAAGFSLKGIYELGLHYACMLLGFTVFSISVYNRIYVIISAVLFYFAVKNITKRGFVANLFLGLFLFGIPVLDFTLKPDATVVYMTLVALYLLVLSLAFLYRKNEEKYIHQIVSTVVVISLFFMLLCLEQNSIIFALPTIVVFLSGYNREDKKKYFILLTLSIALLLAVLGVGILCGKIVLAKYVFYPYFIKSITSYGTTLLVLNILGFIGVYGIWYQKLYYILPFVTAVFYMSFGTHFSSGIDNSVMLFLSFVFYATLGIGMLEQLPLDEKVEEVEKEVLTKGEDVMADETKQVVSEQENLEEIKTIKEMNKKLNEVDLEFIPMTFKKPKKQEKKTFNFGYEPTEDEMKFDVEITEDDDFDI